MGTGSGAINDLTGLLNCGGNCNCCDELKQRITQLENKLNEKISKDDLNPAIMMVLGAVLPGAIANGVKPFLGGLQGQITALGLRVTGIGTELGRLAGMVFALKAESATAAQLARTAMLEVNRLRLEVALAKADAVKALGTSQSAMSKALQNASALASLASVVLGIMNTIAILTVIIPRLDGLDKRCDALGAEISRVFTTIGLLKSELRHEIKIMGDTLLSHINYVSNMLGTQILGVNNRISRAFDAIAQKVDKSELANIQSEISSVRGTANNALAQSILAVASIAKIDAKASLAINKADTAFNYAQQAQTTAKQAQTTAQKADSKADNAQNTATKADSKATQAQNTATQAQNKAEDAQKQAEDAYMEAVIAKIISEFSKNKAVQAENKATQAENKATQADNKATQADNKATNAQTTANNLQGTVNNLQGTVNNLQTQVTNIYNTINNYYNTVNNDLRTQLESLNNSINTLNKQLNDLSKRVQTIDQKTLENKAQLEQFKKVGTEKDKEQDNKLTSIFNSLGGIAALATAAWALSNINKTDIEKMKLGDQKSRDMLEKIYNQTTPTQQQQNTSTAICKSTQPGGCMRKSFDDLGTNIGNKVNDAKNKTMDFLKKSHLLNAMTYFLNILNFAMNLHNAVMLSRNVVDSLGYMIDNVLKIFNINPKDENGGDITVTSALGQGFKDIVLKVLDVTTTPKPGQTEEQAALEAYNAINAKWNAFSRIYQAAMNTVYTVSSIMDSTRNIIEIVGNYTGKIGNALKRSGVVLENSYNWMHTDLNSMTATSEKWQKLFTKIEDTDNVVSSLSSVTSDVLSITENVKELTNNRKEVETAVKEFENLYNTSETTSKTDLSKTPDNLNSASIGKPVETVTE